MVSELKKISADEELRRRMEDRERGAFDMAVIRGAAFKQGKLEGKLEGKAEEMAVIISRLHAGGLSVEELSFKTGLKPEEIKKLLSASL